jgi:transposase-like protein
MPTRPAPKTAFHPLEVLTRRGATQQEVAQTLGITVEEVAKVRRQLTHLNWTAVGAAYELIRLDRRNQLQETESAASTAGVYQRVMRLS